jgi:hypothetical protein
MVPTRTVDFISNKCACCSAVMSFIKQQNHWVFEKEFIDRFRCSNVLDREE